MADTTDVLDVAVVGGGVSGVYSAWRLITADPPPEGKLRITLFEASDRIGGRLLSATPPGMPHVRCELGGMRYMSTQPLVRSLVENELKLQTHPFPVNERKNIAFLRGRHLRLSELTDPDKVPYNLSWAERGYDPGDLMALATDQIVPNVTHLRGEALWNLLKNYLVADKHLSDWGYWNLIARAMSTEAYAFTRDAGGYDTAYLNWNAADTINFNFDFVPGVKFSALTEGYQSVPRTLCDRFVDAGGIVEMETRLRSFHRDSLHDGSPIVRLEFDGDKKPIYARALILAMPRRSLELLDPTCALLDPDRPDHRRIMDLIRSVTPIPLYKMFVCYPYPWWESTGVQRGRSVTDLPIRQCYYWGTEGKQPGADPENNNSVLLATYDDSLNVGFWSGFGPAKEPMYETRAAVSQENLLAEHPASPEWDRNRAPQAAVEEIQRQLKEMHGLRYAPEPYSAAFKNWGEDPYGGGANFWNIHVRSWDIIPQIAHPLSDLPVYICGEAYSNGQGWVEGALETAELVLQKHFGVPAPDWVRGTAEDLAPAPTGKTGRRTLRGAVTLHD
jgi:monoamine oxidase